MLKVHTQVCGLAAASKAQIRNPNVTRDECLDKGQRNDYSKSSPEVRGGVQKLSRRERRG